MQFAFCSRFIPSSIKSRRRPNNRVERLQSVSLFLGLPPPPSSSSLPFPLLSYYSHLSFLFSFLFFLPFPSALYLILNNHIEIIVEYVRIVLPCGRCNVSVCFAFSTSVSSLFLRKLRHNRRQSAFVWKRTRSLFTTRTNPCVFFIFIHSSRIQPAVGALLLPP